MEQFGRVAETDGSRAPVGRAAREVERNTPLRQARTCYHHLAGVAGVQLLEEMLRRGWLTPDPATRHTATTRLEYSLSPLGVQALAERGVDLAAVTRSGYRLAYGCPDWTEGRPHLAGALGAAVLESLAAAGVIEQAAGTRVVRQGRSLSTWLDGSFGVRA